MRIRDSILDGMQTSLDEARNLQADSAWWDEDEEAMELLEGALSGVIIGFIDAAEFAAHLKEI